MTEFLVDYNSNRKKLELPEYGRHIQKMVDYAVTIEDRDERRRCANSIITVMGNFFPHLRDINDFKHKLWDHLAIMSDFKLDIDFPYALPERENFLTKPQKIEYSDHKMCFRHYGTLIEKMIKKAATMEDGELKDHLIYLIASHMRKSLMTCNKDNATDDRIIHDIKIMSDGLLNANSQQIRISENRERDRDRDSQNRNRKRSFQKKN
jgi:hypothetical protein